MTCKNTGHFCVLAERGGEGSEKTALDSTVPSLDGYKRSIHCYRDIQLHCVNSFHSAVSSGKNDFSKAIVAMVALK